MKQLSLAFNVLLLALIILLCLKYCKKDPCSKCPGNGQQACQIIGMDEINHAPRYLLKIPTATMMFDDYKNDPSKAWMGGVPGDDSSRMDALSFQFPMARMKNLIWYVEKKLCDAGCSDTSRLALRAFYAKYPETLETADCPADLVTVPKKYRGKHTLFFVPMYKNAANDEWIAFDPDMVQPQCQFPDPAKTEQQGLKHVFDLMLDSGGEDGSNHGGLHPPPYDDGSTTFPIPR